MVSLGENRCSPGPKRDNPQQKTSTVTRSQRPAASTSQLIEVLEDAWAVIRDRHPQVPEVLFTLASGTERMPAGQVRLGHFADTRWSAGSSGDRHELFVGGEGLAAGADDVFATLLHEAAHAMAFARGVKDTSRQGRYHNARYAQLARELGLEVATEGTRGWTATSVPPATVGEYQAVVDAIGRVIVAWRRSEHRGLPDVPKASDRPPPLVCGCDRTIRAARSVAAAGPIICGCCDQEFQPRSPADEDGS